MVQGRWPPQPLDEWFGTTPPNGDVVNALCDRWKRMLYQALKEIDNGGVAGSAMPFGKQTQGVAGGWAVTQQRVRARVPMDVEQTPQCGSTRQMLHFTNAKSPLGRQSASLEEFWETLNKFKEEEGTSGEACVQSSRVEAPCAPPAPMPQASGKQHQQTKQFRKAVQAQAQQAKPKAKQAPKPEFKLSGVQSKKLKKVPNPDDSCDESSPILTDGSEDNEDSPLRLKRPPTERSKVKQKNKKLLTKTQGGMLHRRRRNPCAPRTKLQNNRLRRRSPHLKTKDPSPQDKDVSEKVCGSTGSSDGPTGSTAPFPRFPLQLKRFPRIALCHQ